MQKKEKKLKNFFEGKKSSSGNCVPVRSDLTTECAEETQKPRNAETQKPRNAETQKRRNPETQKRRNAETQKHAEKKEEKRYRERVLTRISRKTRKDTNEFLKIQKICLRDLFFTAFCIKIRVSLCVFCVVRGKTGTQFPDGPEKSSTFVKIYLSRNVNLGNFA